MGAALAALHADVYVLCLEWVCFGPGVFLVNPVRFLVLLWAPLHADESLLCPEWLRFWMDRCSGECLTDGGSCFGCASC